MSLANKTSKTTSKKCLSVSQTIRNALHINPNAVYKKLKGKSPLFKSHIDSLINFAREQLTAVTNRNDVVFSDEKMFYLNDLDGFKFYWYDLHKEDDLFPKRQFGEGSVIIWAAFAAGGATQIVFVGNKINSELYQDILVDKLLPISPLITSGDCTFQQNKASVHISYSTKS
ncbi:Transposable element Tc3 transposase [Araneus ventricosus]|uniref:Transposable element Tc3 transposase n=1 Tax=Araneus ventricosus TaxID=182803 RepID=A0A4Y2LNB8_ARAVE|nr:Transposable element Tc3 transposase [Araneus ventricosus]